VDSVCGSCTFDNPRVVGDTIKAKFVGSSKGIVIAKAGDVAGVELDAIFDDDYMILWLPLFANPSEFDFKHRWKYIRF